MPQANIEIRQWTVATTTCSFVVTKYLTQVSFGSSDILPALFWSPLSTMHPKHIKTLDQLLFRLGSMEKLLIYRPCQGVVTYQHKMVLYSYKTAFCLSDENKGQRFLELCPFFLKNGFFTLNFHSNSLSNTDDIFFRELFVSYCVCQFLFWQQLALDSLLMAPTFFLSMSCLLIHLSPPYQLDVSRTLVSSWKRTTNVFLSLPLSLMLPKKKSIE